MKACGGPGGAGLAGGSAGRTAAAAPWGAAKLRTSASAVARGSDRNMRRILGQVPGQRNLIGGRVAAVGGRVGHAVVAGQVDPEGRALPGLAVDVDEAAVLLDDAVDRGQPQSRALGDVFDALCAIELVKDLGQILRRNPHARVLYVKPQRSLGFVARMAIVAIGLEQRLHPLGEDVGRRGWAAIPRPETRWS